MDISASPTLALGVFTASLLGSLHCAAMCGGFACLYGGDAAAAGAKSSAAPPSRPLLKGHVAYHGARLLSYASLGAAAGALGAGLDRAGELAGVQRTAGVVAGVLLLVWGLALLANALNVRFLPSLVRGQVPDRAARFMGDILLRFRNRGVAARAGMLGLLTGLLPCGWLYAFVVSAGGTGSAWRGAAFMGLFWLGTVPALVAIATGMQRATGALQRRLPLLSAVIVIGFGVMALSGRIGAGGAQHAAAMSTAADHVHVP